MKNNIFKRSLAAFMSLVICLTALVSTGSVTAFAAGQKAKVYIVSFPRSGDEKSSGNWGHKSLKYMNGWTSGANDFTVTRALNTYEGQACYCIEPGVSQHTGDSYTGWDENFWDNYPSSYNNTIAPYNIKLLIGRIMQYGYTGNISTSWRSQNEGGDKLANLMATQFLIWETVVGERDENFAKVSTGGKNAVLEQISSHPLKSKIMSYYNRIVSSVQSHTKLPSFMSKAANLAQSFDFGWNGEKYVLELTDANNVLANYSFSASESGISFSVSGNKLIITAANAPSDSVTITASKKNSKRMGVITWTDGKLGPNGGIQDVVTYAQSVSDPVQGFVKLKVSFGSAKIVKTSEDGKIEGVNFGIEGNGFSKTVTTDANGEIQIYNLMPGVYTVTEQTADKYEPQEVRRVTVVSGQNATVTFSNTLKRGTLKVTKTSEDGLNEGVKFRLYGTSFSGQDVNEYAVTDNSGTAEFKDVLIGTNYTLEEVDTAIRYVLPDAQSAAVEWNKTTEKTFSNILKKFSVTVTKSDSEKGAAQGNASLAGAKYGIYKGEQLIDTYVTDENGQFTTSYYVCGDDWKIREIEPSEGYLLNEHAYSVGAEAKRYKVEYSSTSLDVLETVAKGKIAVIKHSDDGSTQIETPEEGAEFEVYLKSAGSYDKAKDTERDILTCDENGFAETKDLPYGVYTVKQTKGLDGRELMPPFDVFVSENGQIYRCLINNAVFKSLIEIVKKDAETGKVIPAAGIGFKVRDCATGKYIVQHINYPTPTDIDTYYTDSTGKLMLPEALKYGSYELVEVQTAYGYVLEGTPVKFKVDGSQAVVTVEKKNIAQKGKITIEKTGEVFSSVSEANGTYQPIYELKGLEGAVYEVKAAEDVITLDGTQRYTKGDVVATITTDEKGIATTEPLYLGKYKIYETSAPYGMVLNTEVRTVELEYAGQEVEITETSVSFVNERQKAAVQLLKIIEQDENFGIGMNGEINAVSFGLYAAEDLTAADGSIIPKDGLLEIISCDKDGRVEFKTDIPVGAKLYVKEIATDSHYLTSSEKYPVTFEYSGQDVANVKLLTNYGGAIQNALIRGKIVGKKVDEDGNVIKGALFGLFNPDTTEFTEKTAILTSESNENGEFVFDNVPYGNWIVRELKPAERFVLNENVYNATISENEQAVEIEIQNRFITGSVQTTKVDTEYPDNKLTGAVFEIYFDADGNEEFSAETDTLVGEMNEVETGIYSMEKLRYGGYFMHEKTAPSGFIRDNGYYYFEIRTDGEAVTVENQADVGFVNQPVTGELELTKRDIANGQLLPNAGFRVKNEQGEVVAEGYTDKNGIAKFTLRCGRYTYEEFDAPDGYLIDTTPHEFEITEDGQVIKAEMTNKKIPVTEIPQTGDDSLTGVWLGLAAVALGGLIALAVVTFRRKKDEGGE